MMEVKFKPAVPSIVKYGARNAKNDLQVKHFIKQNNVPMVGEQNFADAQRSFVNVGSAYPVDLA